MNPAFFEGTEQPMTVAENLARSMQAHLSAGASHMNGKRPSDFKVKWAVARQYRLAALALDPERKDAAWGEERVGHEAFMAFYEAALGPVTE